MICFGGKILKSYFSFQDMENGYVVTFYLSYDVASGSEITSCNKIDKPLVVYKFSGNVTTSIKMLRT